MQHHVGTGRRGASRSTQAQIDEHVERGDRIVAQNLRPPPASAWRHARHCAGAAIRFQDFASDELLSEPALDDLGHGLRRASARPFLGLAVGRMVASGAT